MSEIQKENQDTSLNLDSFDDEDDLWALQSDKDHNSSVDIDGFDEEEQESSDLADVAAEGSSASEDNRQNQILEEKNDSITEDLPVQKIPEEVSSVTPEKEKINNLEDDLVTSLAAQENNRELASTSAQSHPEVTVLSEEQEILIQEQTEITHNINSLVKSGLKDLEEKKKNLELTIAKLERRREQIEQEMKTSFAGVSQDLAIRVQGFKDYLVGSLEDLVAAAEQLELAPSPDDTWEEQSPTISATEKKSAVPQFAEQNFTKERNEIRRLLDQYRTRPDYYGPPWQLRRTFEPIHAQKVADWFFNQGGRGALTSMGSRLQNILIGSAIISILSHLYGDRSRILILADTPEKLGEWRRGLQDCLGISRSDFGPNRGVILFETTSALITKGDRIVAEEDLPLVIMDLNDDRVSLSLLKFPLWLAFAPESPMQSQDYYY